MVQINLLGPAFIQTESSIITFSKKRPAFIILSYVLAHNYRIPRAKLYQWIWADKSEAYQQEKFRWHLSQLKKLLPDLICADKDDVWWEKNAGITLDIHTFDQLSNQADTAADLKKAVALYRGEYLEGVNFDDVFEAEQWLYGQRQRWQQRYLQLLKELVAILITQDQHNEANDYLNKWLALDPDNEIAHRQKMLLLSQQGNWQKAILYYQTYAKQLAAEHGVEPMLDTQKLAKRIQQAIHRPRRHQLPAIPKPFIGRTEEIAAIKQLLAQPNCRLINIMGSGGVGKTHLAIEIAHAKQNAFLKNVYFVYLAHAPNSQIMALSIASEMFVSFQGEKNFARYLARIIQDQETLIILDNFEHLYEHRDFVTQLLSYTKNLKIIVTSRFRLGLQSEYPIFLSGLPVVSQADVSPAVQLFMQSGQRVNPDLQLTPDNHANIIEICKILDGLPLGIELAASWVRVLSCEEILDDIKTGLDFLANPQSDLAERHNSIQAIFYSTWKLLSDAEQSLLRRLAVFKGTFNQKATRGVLQAHVSELANLVDRSVLAVTNDNRYYLHSLIAPYLTDLLAENGMEYEAVHQAHAKYYVALIESNTFVASFETGEWHNFDHLREELDNCLGAWQWVVQNQYWTLIAPMLNGLFQFYVQSGKWQDGVAWLDEFLVPLMNNPKTKSGFKDNLYAKNAGIALTKKGHLQYLLKNYPQAEQCLQQGLAYLQKHGSTPDIAQANIWMGDLLRRQEKWQEAYTYLQEGYNLSVQTGDEENIVLACTHLAIVTEALGDHEAQVHFFDQLIQL